MAQEKPVVPTDVAIDIIAMNNMIDMCETPGKSIKKIIEIAQSINAKYSQNKMTIDEFVDYLYTKYLG